MSKEYQEGRIAYTKGMLLEANPYIGGVCRLHWNMGWLDAQEENDERSEYTDEFFDG